ncbi:metallophosphoesterase family protein [Balneolaceae bacterium ANBcel3]|nr:metallophosphoesterase family protein [Balneolaceae bacterium ANBcel3]
MIKIGLISDTHHFLDPQIPEFFSGVDEIWHAGDFGTIAIARELERIAPVTGVYGNIDGRDIRLEYPLNQRFVKEGVDVWMTHIGGNPGRYALPLLKEMEANPPDLFICGHTHVLKIARDKELNNMIYMNPGAAGIQGFQEFRTMVRFNLDQGKVKDAEVINLGRRSLR